VRNLSQKKKKKKNWNFNVLFCLFDVVFSQRPESTELARLSSQTSGTANCSGIGDGFNIVIVVVRTTASQPPPPPTTAAAAATAATTSSFRI
jgi:hypothetical protein